jgi:hypothetical protein
MNTAAHSLVVLTVVTFSLAVSAQDAPDGQPTSCVEAGGECMEGCEPGYRNVGPLNCFDSTCCVAPDQSEPASVVAELFTAARMNDFTSLAHLCAPAEEADGDVQGICGLAADPSGGPEFVQYFAAGSLAGEPTITGDTAAVPFMFGPDGSRSETMNLVRRGEKWFLQSF